MSAVAKVDIRDARQRAGQIRQGIHNYLETLGLIAKAWQEQDWRTLAYDSWDAYVAEEFGETRLRLPTEHREKAVRELRLAGMSQRAIGTVVGIPQTQVSRDLASDSGESDAKGDLPTTTLSLDGRQRPATQSARRTKKADEPTEGQPDGDPAEEPAPGLGGEGFSDRPSSPEAEGATTPSAGDSSLPGGSGRGDGVPEPALPVAGSGASESTSDDLTPSPDARARFDRDREEEEYRERLSKGLARCVWLLAEWSQRADAVKHLVTNWDPAHDTFPKPTTADRLRDASTYLWELAEEWA